MPDKTLDNCDFKKVQFDFMAHIRDPDNNKAPAEIEDRRMGIYRELFFNNIEGFVASAFPVLKSLYNKQDWNNLIRQFFVEHDCKSPYFLDISKEFLDYISNDYIALDSDPDFMLELAHYEWVELALSTRKQDIKEKPLPTDKLQQSPLYLSNLAWPLSYQYPVQFISQDNIPDNPSEQPSYIVVFRDAEDEIQFVSINTMTALLLQVLAENPGISFQNLCDVISANAPHISLEVLMQGALSILTNMCLSQIVITQE